MPAKQCIKTEKTMFDCLTTSIRCLDFINQKSARVFGPRLDKDFSVGSFEKTTFFRTTYTVMSTFSTKPIKIFFFAYGIFLDYWAGEKGCESTGCELWPHYRLIFYILYQKIYQKPNFGSECFRDNPSPNKTNRLDR